MTKAAIGMIELDIIVIRYVGVCGRQLLMKVCACQVLEKRQEGSVFVVVL